MKNSRQHRLSKTLRSDSYGTKIVGQRFGRVTIGPFVGRRSYPSSPHGHLVYEIECECGHRWVGVIHHFISGRARQCAICGRRQSGDSTRVVLPNGETYYTLAAKTGVQVETLRRRWLRGWPLERLIEPNHYPTRKKRHGKENPTSGTV